MTAAAAASSATVEEQEQDQEQEQDRVLYVSTIEVQKLLLHIEALQQETARQRILLQERAEAHQWDQEVIRSRQVEWRRRLWAERWERDGPVVETMKATLLDKLKVLAGIKKPRQLAKPADGPSCLKNTLTRSRPASAESIKVDIWTQSKMWLKRFSLKRQTQHAPATNPVPSAPSDDLPSPPLAFVKQSEHPQTKYQISLVALEEIRSLERKVREADGQF
ncbi:uncharacterized protein LOC134464257 [Engraulis encrasicolus]|uniref:uncharacterized protein LOC134464257 n=1 Tax=Engraulis encrasicolus TaxID=184585 RepID=UPI002FD29CCF